MIIQNVRGVVDRLGVDFCHRMSQMVDQLYVRAATRDTICQQMTDDLRSRTGASGTVNRAGLEPEDFAALQATAPDVRPGIRIAYAGTIIVEPEFALFVSALARVRPQLPRPVSLEFFGDHSYRNRTWFDPAWMTEHGNLAPPQLSAALRQCTWGFLPMALTDDDARYNRFSLPTKFVSYLASGLPILTLGHPESTAVKMASDYGVGFCSTVADADRLAAQLLRALAEPAPGMKFRAAIRQCAKVEFDASRIREALVENFHKCAAITRARTHR